MKINVEVDCTPEEARRFMGLPDLSPVHDRYIAMMMEAIEKQGKPEAAFDAMIFAGFMARAATRGMLG